jgi:site-specific recombinase XerD
MNDKVERGDKKLLPIFDQASYLAFNAALPQHLKVYQVFERDYLGAHAFLYAYKDNKATFNAYRREVERLLHWSWQKAKKSIFDLRRAEIESYIKFCQKPPKKWIGLSKPARFLMKDGIRQPNPNWRPFVATVSKIAARAGEKPSKDNYALSEKAVREIFAILSTFYNFLIQDEYTEVNPIMQIRQKSKFIRRTQHPKKIRRLSDLQWSFVIETAELMAEKDDRHERTLFILSALYLMYLRVSELVVTDRWSPKMNDFKRDHDGLWWFTTVGKGNKEREIAVSKSMLAALKRWRKHLGRTLLPSPDDQTPLVPTERGKGCITSTNQIRNIVQACFDFATQRMIDEGLGDEIGDLQSATVHWLRHTGISDDVKRRPREHVRDDAGHSSSQTTDRYIDVDLRERHQSAKDKPIKNE